MKDEAEKALKVTKRRVNKVAEDIASE